MSEAARVVLRVPAGPDLHCRCADLRDGLLGLCPEAEMAAKDHPLGHATVRITMPPACVGAVIASIVLRLHGGVEIVAASANVWAV